MEEPMEEVLSNPNQDSVAQKKKHEAMLERLSNLHQSRIEQVNSRKSSDSTSTPSFESTKTFLSRFFYSKESIQAELDSCRNVSDPDLKSHLKSDLEKISISISHLEKLVAENSYFLPSYEVRLSLKTISELKETLETVSSQVLPKKKFSFKNKPTKKEETIVIKETEVTVSDENSICLVRDSPGFKNKDGVVLVKQFNGSEEGDGDFTLSDLTSCEIRLTGCFRALFIHRLRNCRVYGGAVLGSILIEEVEGCLIMLASHQIRIHHARETDFYLRVRSRPIIEDSNGVKFAPYLLGYEGIEEDLKRSGLDEETGNWANVDDFRWLRAVQSPNWSVLREEERIGTVNIPNSENPYEG